MASAPKAALLKQLRHAGTFRAALRAQSNLAALDLGGAAASGGVRAHRPATQPSPGALMSHQACIDGLPADCGYMVDVYDWAYVSPKLVEVRGRRRGRQRGLTRSLHLEAPHPFRTSLPPTCLTRRSCWTATSS